ncbi:hypothetical protein EGW08_001165 [Elysia chlorotica]|uniref:Uncharacterized protein n=1 Tax=Elysia chlorotica TaxID=188477 RepID=A0A433UB20_ELYCH|nr:hypothetical protein EGW08_001165 [Elysia chlorotica]
MLPPPPESTKHRQLEIFAAPTNPPAPANAEPNLSLLGAPGVNHFAAILGGAGGDGGVAVGLRAGQGGLGAGLPAGNSLQSILALLGDGDGGRRGRRRGRNGKDLATIMFLSTLMNQWPQEQFQIPQWDQQQIHVPPQQGQPWNQQPRQNLGIVGAQSSSRSTAVLSPASPVLPPATVDRETGGDKQATNVIVKGAEGQVSRLPNGKTIVVIPQPAPAKP